MFIALEQQRELSRSKKQRVRQRGALGQCERSETSVCALTRGVILKSIPFIHSQVRVLKTFA